MSWWPRCCRWFYVVHIDGIAGSEFSHDSATDAPHLVMAEIRQEVRRMAPSVFKEIVNNRAGVTITGMRKIA